MKVLVCAIGQPRLSQHTWQNFKKYVLETLGDADLALCGNVCVQNEFTDCAKFIFRTSDLEPENQVWTHFNDVPGFMGIHRGQSYGRRLIELRKVLYENIKDMVEYDQIILTRTDLFWSGPHPKLDNEHIWCLNGEFHGGICDRHMVIPRKFMKKILTAIDIEDPLNTVAHMKNYYTKTFGFRWPIGIVNVECFVFIRMVEEGLLRHVGLYPFPMYLITSEGTPKYQDEIESNPDTLTWPFYIQHNFLSKYGMFTGRSLKIDQTNFH